MKAIDMIRSLTIITILLFTGISVLAQDEGSSVETIIRREMKERRIPGLQIAVVRNGTIVLNRSFGTANIQDNIPVTNKTIFPINSCTKVFTGVALMELAENGKVDLASPISAYLDNLPLAWQTVTIRQLLTHTSGLPDLLKLLDPVTGGVGSLKNEEGVLEKLKTMPMDFKPGDKFSYNQTNAYLLGKIIDKFYGKPFAEVFVEKEFTPAGMKNTLFGDSRDVIRNFAPTYFYRQSMDGRQLKTETLLNNYYEFPFFRRTASGLNSTAEDMAKWVIALQSGKILKSRSSLETMWSPARFNNGKPTPWALGWGINKFRTKHRAVGMSGGGRAAFLIYPDDDLAVIVLTNLGGSYPEDFLEEIAGSYNSDIPKSDPVTLLRVTLRRIGFEKAVEFTDREKKTNPLFVPNEFELNEWAYRMLANNQLKEALEIFKLNVHLFSDSWNAYDSYGEALLKNGRKDDARKMYKRSVELNPNNENGKRVLKNLDK